MDLLDHHPEICATGDRNNPTAGFGREALLPEHYSGDGCGFRFPTCSVRLGCNWGFFTKWVPHYHQHYREWCVGGVNVPDEDTHRTHGWRLCEAARVLTERHPGPAVSFYDTDGVQRLWDLYEEHAFDDSSKIVPCSCQHQKVQMFKVMRSWFNDTEATRSTYRDAAWFSGNFDSKQADACGGAEVRSPSVDWSQYFVVEWRRRDLLAECIDTLYSDDSPVEYVSSTRADVGNIAGRWSEAWGGRPLNVSEITSCMRELKRERVARTSMHAAHPTDAKWLTLYYEDCVLDPEGCLLQIASLLGVDGFGTRQRYAFQADLAEAQRKAKDTWRRAKLKQAQDLLKHHELGLGSRNASAHRLQGQRSRVLALEASFGGPRRGAPASRNVTMAQYLSRDNAELRGHNAKMREEVERLKRMLRTSERGVHDALEQADKLWWEMDNIVQENCTSNANPYGPSHQGLWRQQASMLVQREKEKLKEIERAGETTLWQDGADGQPASARCSGSLVAPSPVLLLDTPTPSPEECRDADHWARQHAPTPGGAGFQQPASVYENISNADALQVELIEQGFGEYTTPIYYLPCDRASGGAEFAAHLLRLPSQYLVPGSAACGPFDMDAFAAQQEEVAARKHPVVALGDVDAAAFVSGLWERGISTRLVIVLGVVRDVLEHRLASYARELRLAHLAAAAVPGDVDAGVDFEAWLTRQRNELQLEALHGLRREWAGMPMRRAWREMKELSLRQISPHELEAGATAPRPAPPVDMNRAARVGVQLVFSDPVASLCVLARSTSLPIPWESYANASRASLGFAKHEVTSFELHNASLNERVAGRVFEQDAREHLFVALASDQLFALAERHGCLGAAIAQAASPAEEAARAKQAEDETAAAREGVDTLGRPVAPVGPEQPKPCEVPYYDESTAPCAPIFAPAEHPMYYFMHTPKTAGSAVSNYLMRLAPRWRVPGAKPSEDFNFTEFAEAAAEVSRRPHAVIAFSHLPPHIFLWKVRGLGERSEDGIEYALSRRPVIVLGLLRDTLTQRLSYFDDFVRPHRDRQAYHPNVRPYQNMFAWSRAPTMVVDGATTGDYPEDMQIRPFMDMAFGAGTNNAWKQANMVDSYEQLHNMVSYTGGRLGFVGTQSNLMATLCVMSRVTPFAIPLGGDAADVQGSGTPQVSERFNEQRPAELLQSFNDSTVREILRRDARELLFLQLAQARFNALAASTGCMPPVGNGLLRQSLTRQALAVSPVSPVVDFPQRRPAPQCMSGPTTRFIIVSLARSGTTWLESMLKQHPDVHTWSEVVREMAGDGVHADRNVAWRTLRELAYMPPGGAPGRLNGTQLSRAKRVQGLKWFNLEGGLDLQFYPPRDTTERLGSFLRQNRFKVVLLERSAGLDMHISTYKHERAVKRMRAAGQDPAGREYFCASGDAACIERNLAEPIALDIPELMRGLNNNERMWKEYRRWANENFCPDDVLHVNYNSFVDEPHRSMDRVFEHLHVDPFHVDLSASTEKMGHTCARDGLVDPDVTALALKGTKWEGQADPCPHAAVSTRRLAPSPQPSPLASPLASTPHLHRANASRGSRQHLDVAMQGMQSARSKLLSAKGHMQEALQRSAALKAAKHRAKPLPQPSLQPSPQPSPLASPQPSPLASPQPSPQPSPTSQSPPPSPSPSSPPPQPPSTPPGFPPQNVSQELPVWVVEGAEILPQGGHPLVALRRVAEARPDNAHHGLQLGLQEQHLDVAMQGMQSARSKLLSAKGHMQEALQRSAALKAAKRLRVRGRSTAMVQQQETELPLLVQRSSSLG